MGKNKEIVDGINDVFITATIRRYRALFLHTFNKIFDNFLVKHKYFAVPIIQTTGWSSCCYKKLTSACFESKAKTFT